MKDRNLNILKYKRGLYTNLDLLIIEALGKYGPRNISKIARELDLAESTIRYRILNLRKKGLLYMSTGIYHTNIGLKKNLVFADLNPVYYRYAPELFRRIDYWTYMRYVHGEKEGFHVNYIAPYENTIKIKEFIKEMKRLDLIYNYKIYYSTCLYGVKPSTRWYDLTDDRWDFNWSSLPDLIDNAETELPYNLRDPKEYPILADKTDIYILKELEKDPTVTYTELAKSLNTTPQAIYYHFNKHIIRYRLIEGFEIFFRKFEPDESLVMYFIIEFTNYDYFAKSTNVFREMPFAHSLGKIIGKNGLFMAVYIPVREIPNLLKSFNDLAELGIIKKYEYKFSHYKEYGKRQTIAYKLFKDGRWEYKHEEYLSELYELYDKIMNKVLN